MFVLCCSHDEYNASAGSKSFELATPNFEIEETNIIYWLCRKVSRTCFFFVSPSENVENIVQCCHPLSSKSKVLICLVSGIINTNIDGEPGFITVGCCGRKSESVHFN